MSSIKKEKITFEVEFPPEVDTTGIESFLFRDFSRFFVLISEYKFGIDNDIYYPLQSEHRWMFAIKLFKIDKKDDLYLVDWKSDYKYNVYILTQDFDILIYDCPTDINKYQSHPVHQKLYEKINEMSDGEYSGSVSKILTNNLVVKKPKGKRKDLSEETKNLPSIVPPAKPGKNFKFKMFDFSDIFDTNPNLEDKMKKSDNSESSTNLPVIDTLYKSQLKTKFYDLHQIIRFLYKHPNINKDNYIDLVTFINDALQQLCITYDIPCEEIDSQKAYELMKNKPKFIKVFGNEYKISNIMASTAVSEYAQRIQIEIIKIITENPTIEIRDSLIDYLKIQLLRY